MRKKFPQNTQQSDASIDTTVFLLPFLCIGITTPSTQDRKCPLLKIILNKMTSLPVIVSQVFTKNSFMSRSGPALLGPT